MTPTALTLEHLRRHGFIPTVVERWIPRVNRRRDAFGFADILAIDCRAPGVLLVQCTSLAHVPDRLAKARARPKAKEGAERRPRSRIVEATGSSG